MNELTINLGAPEALKAHIARLQNTDPELNQWVCIVMLIICICLLAATAEWVGDLLMDT